MWSISELKAKARTAFKGNYWRCVLVGFILSLLTAGTTVSSTAGTGGDADLQARLQSLSQGELQAVLVASGVIIVVICIVSVLLKLFVFNPLEVGGYNFFKKNIDDQTTTVGGSIGGGFKNYGHTFVTLFLKDLFLALWSALFVIPGIIKSYSYCMVPFIIKDNPELSATQVITRSREMMNGNKWRAFLLDLSFIGWILLGCITCGLVQFFWTAPYMYSTHAALYLELKNK